MSSNVIAREIRVFRKSNPNWTQEVFAEVVGVSRVTISKWENGRQIPDFTQRKKLLSLGLKLSETHTFLNSVISMLHGNVALLFCRPDEQEQGTEKWQIEIGDLGLPPNVVEHVLATIPIPRMERFEIPRLDGLGNWTVQILPIEHDNNTAFHVSLVQNIPGSVSGFGRETIAFSDFGFDAFFDFSPKSRENKKVLSVKMAGLVATETGESVNIGVTEGTELPKSRPKRRKPGRPSAYFPSKRYR